MITSSILLETCQRPGRQQVLSRYKAGFRQYVCNEMCALQTNNNIIKMVTVGVLRTISVFAANSLLVNLNTNTAKVFKKQSLHM